MEGCALRAHGLSIRCDAGLFLVIQRLTSRVSVANKRQIHRVLDARKRQPVRPGAGNYEGSTEPVALLAFGPGYERVSVKRATAEEGQR